MRAKCLNCNRPILIVTVTTGHKIEVDPDPDGTGEANVLIREGQPAEVVKRGEGTHLQHVITCPYAQRHRPICREHARR